MIGYSVDARDERRSPGSGLEDRQSPATPSVEVRQDWRLEEIRALHSLPLLDLVFRAATVHRRCHAGNKVQVCKLISIKTGACPEDCAYCSQSARYDTGIEPQRLMDKEAVLDIARRAKEKGVSRVCLGAAWREVRDDAQFDRVLDMVKEVTGLGIEVCCTLGLLTESQAQRLEQAGLYAYNHNLDTSAEYYPTIITPGNSLTAWTHCKTCARTKSPSVSAAFPGWAERVKARSRFCTRLGPWRPHPNRC